jgi:hypothetical protein
VRNKGSEVQGSKVQGSEVQGFGGSRVRRSEARKLKAKGEGRRTMDRELRRSEVRDRNRLQTADLYLQSFLIRARRSSFFHRFFFALPITLNAERGTLNPQGDKINGIHRDSGAF